MQTQTFKVSHDLCEIEAGTKESDDMNKKTIDYK